MRQSPLGQVRNMLKAELAKSLQTTSTAQDAELNQVISDIQGHLASMCDWPFLKQRWDTMLAPVSRYQVFPTTTNTGEVYAPNIERPVQMFIKWNQIWQPIVYGIDEIPELNYVDSDRNQVLDPIQRWQFDDELQYEVWPLPAATAQTRFVGQRALTSLMASSLQSTTAGTANANGSWQQLVNANALIGQYYVNTSTSYTLSWLGGITNGANNVWAVIANGTSIAYANALYTAPEITGTWIVGPASGTAPVPVFTYQTLWNDGAELDLDALLVVYYAAAEYAQREKRPSFQFLLDRAQRKLNALRGAYPIRTETYCIGRGQPLNRKLIRQVPLVLIAGSSQQG